MNPSLTDTLCTRCGLCCDGSLFADVELASSGEASALEVLGLDLEDADAEDCGLLLQPCAALKGKRCSIYPYRPDCCRTFECRLLQEVRRGSIGIVAANERIAETLKRIERVKKLVVQLRQSNESLPLQERGVEALELAARRGRNQSDSLSSIGWRRGPGSGGTFSENAPLPDPLPTRSSPRGINAPRTLTLTGAIPRGERGEGKSARSQESSRPASLLTERSPKHVAADPDLNRTRAELQTAMTSLESLIQETFLGGGNHRRFSSSRSALHRVPT